ncbi:hypothetical protein BDB01DRAFT_55291 [Pilobolus umbonatus]|nr:hypothetical protein BDB01DRAFT_55291 [Pilobolus umbonatus]
MLSSLRVTSRRLVQSTSRHNHFTRLISISCINLAKEKAPKQEYLSDSRFQELLEKMEKPLLKEEAVQNDSLATLLDSINALKPTNSILNENDYNNLIKRLEKSHTVRQLGDYLLYQGYKRNGLKSQLIQRILNNIWNVKSEAQTREEERVRLRNLVIQHFPTSKQELFFIINDNAENIKEIESRNQVNVTVDIENNTYSIEGHALSVNKAKNDITSYLKITEEVLEIPKEDIKVNMDMFHQQIRNELPDISIISNSFISLSGNTFTLSARTPECIEKAKRLVSVLLTELELTEKKSVDKSDHTVIQASGTNDHTYDLLPIHDSESMPVFHRRTGWSRINFSQDKIAEEDEKLLSVHDQQLKTYDDIKHMLLNSFDSNQLSNISLEARFGYVLFNNDKPNKSFNILPALDTNIDIKTIDHLLKKKTLFFNGMPPRNMTSPMLPLIVDGDFKERTINVEYINKSLLVNLGRHVDDNKGNQLNRLNMEFLVKEQGDMILGSITGEKKRSAVDIIGLAGHVDARIIAKEIVEYSVNDLPAEMNEFIKQFQLLAYSELNAPNQFKDRMSLMDVTFKSKKRYIYENNLISLDHIVQQDQQSKRTELIVNSVESDTLNTMNGFSRWDSFIHLLSKIAHRWDYSTV